MKGIRTEYIGLRVTKEFKEHLLSLSNSRGLSMSDYLAKLIMGEKKESDKKDILFKFLLDDFLKSAGLSRT